MSECRPSLAARVGAALRSVRLCVAVLLMIAAASIVGSLVPQQHGAEFYVNRYGRVWGSLVLAFRVDELYGAPWFLALLGVLAVNVLACAVHRLRLRVIPLSSVLAHSSLLLILSGGFVDFAWGEDGYVQIARGGSTDEYVDAGERRRKLGYRIELVDFQVEHEPERQRVVLFRSGRSPAQEVCLNGRLEHALKGGFGIRILKEVAEFEHATSVPEEVRTIEALRGPAALVEVAFPDGRRERRWLFGANPSVDINAHADRSVRVAYVLRPVPRDYVSRLRVHDGDSTARGEARSNVPFSYGGRDFTPLAYDEQAHAWSALRVTRQPGMPLVLIGLVLLIAGVSVRVVLSLERSRRKEASCPKRS